MVNNRNAPIFVLKVTPKDFAAKFRKTRAVYTSRSRQAIDLSADLAKKTIQELVPVRTGRLKSSIRIKSKKTSSGTTDLRSEIIIGSDLIYYTFIDIGTKGSPGRFVPAIGKRLINEQPNFGFHPGIEAQNITERAKDRVEKSTGVELKKVLRNWETTWNSNFSVK